MYVDINLASSKLQAARSKGARWKKICAITWGIEGTHFVIPQLAKSFLLDLERNMDTILILKECFDHEKKRKEKLLITLINSLYKNEIQNFYSLSLILVKYCNALASSYAYL